MNPISLLIITTTAFTLLSAAIAAVGAGRQPSPLKSSPDAEPAPPAGEREQVLKLHRAGESQAAIIKAVWGISPSGSKAYREAKARFSEYTALVEA